MREENWGDERSVNVGDGEMLVSKLSPTFFLKPLTEGAVTTETGSLFQHFSALTEKTAPPPSSAACTFERTWNEHIVMKSIASFAASVH